MFFLIILDMYVVILLYVAWRNYDFQKSEFQND